MPVTSISEQQQLIPLQQHQKSIQKNSFAQLLNKQKEIGLPTENPVVQKKVNNLIEVGLISEDTPTVSHILKNNESFKDEYWNIIYSDINKNKQYTNMLPGTKVSIDRQTNELVWSKFTTTDTNHAIATSQAPPFEKSALLPSTPPPIKNEEQITVGVISKENSTVSHLLENNKNIPGNFWNIIYDPVNQEKPFTALTPGTKVDLNTSTNELIFNNGNIKAYTKVQAFKAPTYPTFETHYSQTNAETSFSEKLADSIKPLIGKPYNEIDCYGLVVRGLIKQGVNYQGKGGLRQSLETAAKFKGLPGNAFLTGEGLVKNTGTTLHSKTYLSITNSEKQSDEIFSEIENNLETGLILSFSTPSRGHTGVVAKRDNLWTYINSGLMDNSVNQATKVSRKVGEEKLQAEIKNWCKLAQNRNEPLTVTIGRLDEEKLKRFSKIDRGVDLSKL